MNSLDVALRITNLHCFDEADSIGSAEPYLWTVFFKIDGDTVQVNPSLTLQGTATVVTTAGNHNNLPNHDVDPGENVPIPTALGVFNTRLRPIPLVTPLGGVTEVGGVMGVIVVLMEEDNTSNSDVAKGHDALNKAVQDSLNALIPTLNFTHQEPTPAEIEAMKTKIGDTVTNAIKDEVSIWDWLKGFGNMDDKIGSEVFRFSHGQLESAGLGGVEIRKRFMNEGDWEIQGRVTSAVVGAQTGTLAVAVSGIPATVTTLPIRVSGPSGFSRSINKSTTFNGVPVGTYTISANVFNTGLPNKPSCRTYTPSTSSQQRVVNSGQTAGASVSYTSESCAEIDERPDRR